ncbi:MAG TPA: hypothetical protein VMT88_11080 [Actinomycetes bacterium]|nr:hypothetical protein [Actinomycetes bacterium]
MRLSRSHLTPRTQGMVIAIGAVGVAFAVVAGAGFARGAQRSSELTGGEGGASSALHLDSAACVTTALPTLGGAGGNVVSASSNGLYVGIADDAAGVSQPVLWSEGHVQRLRVDLESAMPSSVNRHGVVVGTGYDRATQKLVGWWWAAGRTRELPIANGDIAQPAAIDNTGHIVGSLVADEEHADGPGADEDARAAYWSSPDAMPSELPTLRGDSGAEAFAIAPDGIVGGVSLGSGGSPVWWSRGGQVHRLEGVAGPYGVVLGFDRLSRPVGQSSVVGGTRAVVWDKGGAPTDLGAELGAQSQAVTGAQDAVIGSVSALPSGVPTRVQGILWSGGTAHLMPPLSDERFNGVEGVANAVTTSGAALVAVGFSADSSGLRRPTEWTCSR